MNITAKEYFQAMSIEDLVRRRESMLRQIESNTKWYVRPRRIGELKDPDPVAETHHMVPIWQDAIKLMDEVIAEKEAPARQLIINDKTDKMETQEILLKCTVVGNIVKLPVIKLDQKSEYFPVKQQLENIGGKWNTRAQGFVFEEDPTELLARLQKGEKINLKQDFQFFATPGTVASIMVTSAVNLIGVDKIKDLKILEPSAGDGALVKEIVKQLGDHQRVDCFELMELNRIKLQKVYGADILGNDFLEAVEIDTMNMIRGQYDLVIANPPFTKNSDIDHIRAMYKCLKPGGRIITLSSPSWVTGEQKKQVDFREWLSVLGSKVEEIGRGQFKESGTNISTYLISFQRPIDECDVVARTNVVPSTKQPHEYVPAPLKEPHTYLDELKKGNQEIAKSLDQLQIMLNPEIEEMDFFKQVSELIGESEISFTLKSKGENMTVMITRGKTASSKIIPPLIINGTPADLDEGFFTEISSALSKMTGLSSNAKDVEAAIDETGNAPVEAEKPAPVEKKKKRKSQEPATDPGESAADQSIDTNGIGDVVQSVSEDAKSKEDEQAKLEAEQKSQEEHRIKLEQEEAERQRQAEEKAEQERVEKYNNLNVQANDHASNKEFRQAAMSLKAAKEFSQDPDALNAQIKEYLLKAAEMEMEEL